MNLICLSVEKEVKKVVIFTETASNRFYNLALLKELEDGELSDTTESNNKDLVTIMATVIKIIDDFLNKNPQYFVLFSDIDDSRQRLYRIIISRELNTIREKFDVFGGVREDTITVFEKDIKYNYYIIRKQ